MTINFPPEIEQHLNELVLRSAYPSAEAVLLDAMRTLVREQESDRMRSLLDERGIGDACIEQLLQEAEDSSGYVPRIIKRAAAVRDHERVDHRHAVRVCAATSVGGSRVAR